MEYLQKIWNYRPSRTDFVKQRALHGLCLFLAVMVCCTLVSRAADSMTLALVKTSVPQRQAISHTIRAEGTLEAIERVPVLAEPDTMVLHVLVSEGQQVEEGELLFALDMSDLRRRLAARQLEWQSLNLQLNAQLETAAIDQKRSETALLRTQEDYEYLKDQAERATAAALDTMNEARHARDSYDSDKYEDPEGYEAAVKQRRADYRASVRAYEQALADEARVLSNAQRDIDDADTPQVNIQADLLAVDLQLKALEIAQLQEVLATNGQVYAPAGGVISGLEAEVGKRTGSNASGYIISEGALRFTAELTEEEQKHVERGSQVSLSLPGRQQPVADLQVASVSPIAGSRKYKMTVLLPEGIGEADLSATVEVVQKSRLYETCVPLSALYQANNQYYLFALEEVETPLGLEQTVRKIDVTLEESNETMAAVSGALFRDSRVISSTSRTLSSGDRVRLQEDS